MLVWRPVSRTAAALRPRVPERSRHHPWPCTAAVCAPSPRNSSNRATKKFLSYKTHGARCGEIVTATLMSAAGGCACRMCSMTATCLIGEADPFLARLLERFGSASGLTVVWAKVGQELLNLAQTLRPDIIVVDPELPGTLRGSEALRAIGADSGLAHIPVLTCSWLSEATRWRWQATRTAICRSPSCTMRTSSAALAGVGLSEWRLPAWQTTAALPSDHGWPIRAHRHDRNGSASDS